MTFSLNANSSFYVRLSFPLTDVLNFCLLGDKLNEGDLLAEIETDKATMGFETPEEGYLAKIIVPAGTKNVPIGKLVCIIVQEESSITAFKDFKDDAAAPTPTAPPPTAPTPITPPPTPTTPPAPAAAKVSSIATPSEERIYISPLARRLATEKGLSLQVYDRIIISCCVIIKLIFLTKSF